MNHSIEIQFNGFIDSQHDITRPLSSEITLFTQSLLANLPVHFVSKRMRECLIKTQLVVSGNNDFVLMR